MRIAIDATPLLLRSAGVKNYLYHWIEALRKAQGEHSILTYPVSGPLGPLDHEHSQAGRFATFAGLAYVHAANILPLLDFPNPGWDLFHAANLTRRPPRKIPLTATVHDMTCWLMPELHSPANVKAAKTFAERVLKRAARLIAVSEATRQDAIRLLDVKPERICTIHSGVAPAFFDVSADETQDVRKKHGIERPYALFVGTVEPRKNIDGLLDAWDGLPHSTRDQFDLVVAGPAGWADRALVERLKSGANGVRYLGYVPEPDLPAITAGAELLVYPSLYEGFGFPVAQAMAAGVAVLTSGNSSLPEVAGKGAVYVDPKSVAELRSELQRLLTSESLRRNLAARGRFKAEAYRWEECARRSLEFFAAAS